MRPSGRNSSGSIWRSLTWTTQPLPRNFLDEVETELRVEQHRLSRNRDRLQALEKLHGLALVLTAELERPVTVFDVIRSASQRKERNRRLALVRQLRDRILNRE